MHCRNRLGLLCILVTGCVSPSLAQDSNVVGFDRTPVSIPLAASGESRPITSMDLLEIRDQLGVSISPDARYVAVVVGQAVYETNDYRTGIYVIATAPHSSMVCLGTAGVPRRDSINQHVSEAPQWSPDERYVTRIAKMNPSAHWQVWRWDINGGPPVQITSVPGDVESYHWNSVADKIVVTFAKPRNASEERRLSEDGILYDGSFLPASGRPVISEALSAIPPSTETWIHDVITGEERIQTKAESDSIGPWVSDIGEAYFDFKTVAGHHLLDAKISPDGRRVAYRLLADSKGSNVLYKLFSKPVRGGTPVEIARGVYFVADYWWSADSSRIYVTQYLGDGRPATFVVVPSAGGSPRQVFSSSDSLTTCSYDRNFEHMACASESRRAPSTIAFVDLAEGKVRTLFDLNPEFQNRVFGTLTRLEGVNSYGDRWWADFVKPVNYEAGKKYPLIVTTYRTRVFPRGASGDENPVDVYAAQGFAVLVFDFGRRDYDTHSGNFEQYLSWYESVDASIQMAIDAASKTGVPDLTKLGLTGYSRGTEIVAYEITHNKLFRVVSGAAGDGSPYFFYMASEVIQNSFSNLGLGGWPEGKSKANWKRVAPDLNADQIDAPVLNNDPDSEFLGDLSLYTSLQETGKPVELFIYPDELHHIDQPKHRYQMYERNVDWFRFWLKNEEDPSPSKAGQFARWRGMRELRDHNTSQWK